MKIYHRQIVYQVQKGKLFLVVMLEDLRGYEDSLYERFKSHPIQCLSLMEEAVKGYV